MRIKLSLSKNIKQLILTFLFFTISIVSYAHSVAVFIEMGANNQVRFHVLSWHRPSEFGGRPSGAMFVNGARYNFAAVNAAPIPSGYRLIASCSNWATNNNSRFAYQSTGWISGLNLCQTLNFNMTSNILETPACNLSGSLDLSVPLIVSQPSANTRLCQGNNFSASIAASGFNLSYQWQLSTNGGGSWTNITGNGYSGFNSTNLTYSGVTTSMNNYSYRCVVTSTIGDPCPKTTSINSNSLTIVVAAPTSITSQPAGGVTACNGSSQSIAVVASGTNLTYQWQYSNNQGTSYTNIAGATSASLSFLAGSSVAYANGNYLRAVVNGTCGTANSNATVLTVNSNTSITSGPSSVSICDGANTSFSISAAGSGLSYQWQVRPAGAGAFANVPNSGIYTGTTTSTLSITGAAASLGGASYRCIVSGACSSTSVASGEATLTVNRLPNIITHPATTVTACAPAQTSFTIAATGTNLSYQWQVNIDSSANWSNISGSAYTVSNTSTTSTISITPSTSMHRYRFRCIVSGTCSPSVTSNIGILNVSMPAAITAQPVSLSPAICEATNTSFNFSATGSGLTYKWQLSSNGGNSYSDIQPSANYLNVNTSTLNVIGLTRAMDGLLFKGVAMGTCGAAAETNVITLTVKGLPRIDTDPIATTVCMPSSPAFSVQTSGAGLVYQWQSSTTGTNYSDVSNGQVYSGSTSSLLDIVTAESLDKVYYRMKLVGECSANPVFSKPAILNVHSATNIVQQPADKDVCIYGRVYITLVNAGLGNTYQWQESADGQNWSNLTNAKDPNSGFSVSGATKDSLMLSSVPFEKNGYSYRCVITSNCPSANTVTNSNPSTLTVLRKPLITVQPVNANNNLNVQNIFNDPNTATYIFNVTATGRFNDNAASGIFQWWQSVDGGASWTSINDGNSTMGGNSYAETTTTSPAYTSRLAVTIPKGSIADKTKYLFRCLVNGVCDMTTSRVVTINPPPKINR